MSHCGVWFIIDLLRLAVVCRFVAAFYLCRSDSDTQSGFNQLNISNYNRQYIEELKS